MVSLAWMARPRRRACGWASTGGIRVAAAALTRSARVDTSRLIALPGVDSALPVEQNGPATPRRLGNVGQGLGYGPKAPHCNNQCLSGDGPDDLSIKVSVPSARVPFFKQRVYQSSWRDGAFAMAKYCSNGFAFGVVILAAWIQGPNAVFGQDVNDFLRILAGDNQHFMRQAARAAWRRLPPAEVACIDQKLRHRGSSVNALASRGVMPSEAPLAQLRSGCRRQLAQGPQMGAAQLSPYVVDGLALGGRVVIESKAYKQYQCAPSEKFSGFIWCYKEDKGEGRNGITSYNSILHAQDGTAWYINTYTEPVFLDSQNVQNQIDELSVRFGEHAHEFRMPQREGLPNAIIAA